MTRHPLPTPLEPGRGIEVAGTVEPPDPYAGTRVGWQPIELPDGRARLGLEREGFDAVAAQGTVEILAVRPLQLRFDVLATDAAGNTVRVRGVMEVVYRRFRTACG